MKNSQWQLDLSKQQNEIALQLINLAKIKLGVNIAVNTPIEKLATDVWKASKAAIKFSWLKKFKYFGLKRALVPSKFDHY
jgi:hypothetical protein